MKLVLAAGVFVAGLVSSVPQPAPAPPLLLELLPGAIAGGVIAAVLGTIGSQRKARA